jgi:hypothetical protein
VARFLSFCASFIQTLRIPTEHEISSMDNPPPEHEFTELLVAKTRIQLKQKYEFYDNQLRQIIVPKIVNDYCQRS